MGRYVPYTDEEKQAMLDAVGISSVDELYKDVPEAARLDELNIPEGLSELEADRSMADMAAENTVFRSIFRGAGSYDHYIPAIVKSVTSKEKFVTSYTPYQAEISQGILQSIFEYQTQICELTGMDVSNASVYDGAVAAAEAVFMCQDRKKHGVVMMETVDPQVREVVMTYCESRGVDVTLIPANNYAADIDAMKAALDAGTACVLIQSPNYYGIIEDMSTVTEAAHAAGSKVIMSCNPVSLGILKTPGEYGADIAVGEGQPLGLPMAFGGPYLGFMACRHDMMRKLPGRIVGQTADHDGNRCFVLTLQAREQHIRREKASSNICSNEALCAMTASVYMAAMGPAGMKKLAEACVSHAHYAAEKISSVKGFKLRSDRQFFHEFLTECPADPDRFCAELEKRGILPGLPVDGGILWCCTEKNSKKQIDELASAIEDIMKTAGEVIR